MLFKPTTMAGIHFWFTKSPELGVQRKKQLPTYSSVLKDTKQSRCTPPAYVNIVFICSC